MSSFRKTLLSTLFVVLLALSAQAVTWTAIDVPGATGTQALGLNTGGDIVGLYVNSSNHTHGFLYQAGAFTTIDVPGATQTVAKGINDSGKIVGFYSTTTSDAQGFLYDGQTFTTLSFPGFVDTVANGINNLGQVVGWYGNGGSNPDFHGFSWNGAFTTIEVVPSGTVLSGINNFGFISGYEPVTFTSFVRTPTGTFRLITQAGSGQAEGINDKVALVGLTVDANFGFHYDFQTKSYSKLRYPGALVTSGEGINNNNEIVGFYLDSAGVQHGFLRTQ